MLFIPFTTANIRFKKALAIFVGTDTPDWREINSQYGDWARDNIVLPVVLILTTEKHAQSLKDAAEAVKEEENVFELLGKLSQVYVGSFSQSGSINVALAGDPNFIAEEFEYLVESVTCAFIQSKIAGDSIVIAAPTGFYFSKLSGRFASHFIRTESLLSSTAAIELLALRLLLSFNNFSADLAIVRILLDSMAMWPIAHALIKMHDSGSESRYVIESFRSYEGINASSIRPGSAFVIISASTSGGLEDRVREALGPRSTRTDIWTLIGLQDVVNLDDEETLVKRHEVYSVPRNLEGAPALGGLRDIFEPDVKSIPAGSEAIQVIGERFLSHNVRPKLVRLAHKALAAPQKTQLATLAKDGIVLAARRRAIGKSWWSISFDLRALVAKYSDEGDAGKSPLDHWLLNYGFPGNVAIVYPVDLDGIDGPETSQNEKLAQRAAGVFKRRSPSAKVLVLSQRELDRPDEKIKKFVGSAGVLIISPVIANGFLFKQISATLRELQPRGPRLYIALAALVESQGRFNELKADLESNSEDSAYRFKCGFALPVGRIDESIGWNKEVELLSEIKEECESEGIELPEKFLGRLERLAIGKGLDGDYVFLPTYNGEAQPLTAGFLLWNTKESISGRKHGGCVLFTIAAFLEACRAARSGASETSLISGLFQQTLISPANFTRFNDGVIQAALLRAAYSSELNYSGSTDASKDMAHLVVKLIELYDAPGGSAIPEFLLALALGRLSLTKDDLNSVLKVANELPGWLGVLARKIKQP
jgi:hypothetical protein